MHTTLQTKAPISYKQVKRSVFADRISFDCCHKLSCRTLLLSRSVRNLHDIAEKVR